jgi:pimeloyl-ACP methyl ester carboxylesterase
MPTFVLVHGGWHGSWCWKRVRKQLAINGHDVFTPTLTGLGERSHLLSHDVSLQTHIDDVANLIRWEEATDVVLCGHSYAGLVVTGVAEIMPERIRSLIYLDAFLPESGQSLFNTLPAEAAEYQRSLARDNGSGWLVPPGSAEFFGVNEEDRALVDRLCTPQPLATFEHPLNYSDRAMSIADTRFIHATGWSDSPFSGAVEVARRRGWPVIAIDSGHDVMLDKPDELTVLLTS